MTHISQPALAPQTTRASQLHCYTDHSHSASSMHLLHMPRLVTLMERGRWILCPAPGVNVFLMRNASLVLQVPHGAFVERSTNVPMVVVLASFQFESKFKAGKRAAVRSLGRQVLPLLTQARTCLTHRGTNGHMPPAPGKVIFFEWCSPYPDAAIRDVASEVVQGDLDPSFAGDLWKTTVNGLPGQINHVPAG